MTTLISFLGKGQDGRGYRFANYHFDDNDSYEKQKYFGLTLAQKLKPSKIILLGTSGSMWDVFLEEGGEGLEEEWFELSESVKKLNVQPEQLIPFNDYLSKKLGADVQCILIPFAKTTKEQIDILSILAENLSDNDKVVLDVTHSFRHLPMLSLVASRFLKRTKNITVDQIYYGATDMTQNNQSPVLQLDGMLSMLDWVDALTTFDKDGDYGVFSELLINEGFDESHADSLKQASFYERTTNSSNAKQRLDTIFNNLENLHSPIFELFKPQLQKRLTWFKRSNRGLREQALAKQYLERKDYVRAVIFAMEGIISNKVYHDKQDENSYDDREQARVILRKSEDFDFLSKLRNALVHGLGNQNKDIRHILDKESVAHQSLNQRFKNLFNGQN